MITLIITFLVTMFVVLKFSDWCDARTEARSWAEHLRREAERERILSRSS